MDRINFIGWLGVLILIFALILNVMDVNKGAYFSLNAIGAMLISYTSFKKKDYQPFLLNIIWAIVSLSGIIVQLINS